MKLSAVTVLGGSLLLMSVALAQSTSLTRSEVTAIKAKLVAVQSAMGADPAGYLKDSEDFGLPTESNPARDGKFWPITSGVTLRYKDRASEEGTASAEKAAEEFQAKYAAALASGNLEAVGKLAEELSRIQSQAVAAAMTPTKKENMQVYVQLNQNPTAAIDPDAVVLERPGVIALRRKDDASGAKGDVVVYLDPVALKDTEELSKIELRTADDGVSSKTGVFHVVIQLNGTLADIEQWVKTFDYDKMLAVIDPR
jgi:hypothetical protein